MKTVIIQPPYVLTVTHECQNEEQSFNINKKFAYSRYCNNLLLMLGCSQLWLLKHSTTDRIGLNVGILLLKQHEYSKTNQVFISYQHHILRTNELYIKVTWSEQYQFSSDTISWHTWMKKTYFKAKGILQHSHKYFQVGFNKVDDLTNNEWTFDRDITVIEFPKNKDEPFHDFQFKYHSIFRSTSLNITSHR